MRSAVLFLVFNRPEPTKQVFEAIRQAKPPRLYVAADGPRADKEGEETRCEEVRRIATNIDWPCELITLFRGQNLGCKHAVSEAITWFFEQEEEGIILEDDCLPAQSFFSFCDEMLERYRLDTRIGQISGSTFFPEAITETEADYFFTRYGPIWGWASWRRAWNYYDADLAHWDEMSKPEVMKNVYPDNKERIVKLELGTKLHNDEIDTWDYQWAFVKNYNNALTIMPKLNQIINIGFGEDATHTFVSDDRAPTETNELRMPIAHPHFMIPDRVYEETYARKHFYKRNILIRVFSKAIKIYRETKADK